MRALVTGGGGFLGGAIVRHLRASGWTVRTLQRGVYQSLDGLGAEQVAGDIADSDVVTEAVSGCDVVFHVAARVEMWGDFEPFYRTNVKGTENVIAAMVRTGVGRLVYTSSPSVVHGSHSLEGVDESTPYPPSFAAAYPQTKAMAEQMVLAANGPTLATVAVRPHLVWGPGDTNLVPQLVERARAGRLRFIGDGSNLVDTTYIDNAVLAHVMAAERLAPGADCAGRAYFVSNGDPRPLKSIVNGILAAAGLPPENRSVGFMPALIAGAVCEVVDKVFPFRHGPPMTRFIARNLAMSHWYDISAARRDLGYEPVIDIEEGLRRLAASLSDAPD